MQLLLRLREYLSFGCIIHCFVANASNSVTKGCVKLHGLIITVLYHAIIILFERGLHINIITV